MKKKYILALVIVAFLQLIFVVKINENIDYDKVILSISRDITTEDLDRLGYVDITPPMESLDPKLEEFIKNASMKIADVYKFYRKEDDKLIVGYMQYFKDGDYIAIRETSPKNKYLGIVNFGKIYLSEDKSKVLGVEKDIYFGRELNEDEAKEHVIIFIKK